MSVVESFAELAERLERERQAVLPPQTVRVAITGGRDHIPSREEIRAFFRILDLLRPDELYHGDARGVDRYMGAVVSRERPEVKVVRHPAAWDLYGKRAGFVRNQEMLSRVQALIAFQGGRGTAHCTATARSIGLPVYSVTDEVDREHDSIERDHIDIGVWDS